MLILDIVAQNPEGKESSFVAEIKETSKPPVTSTSATVHVETGPGSYPDSTFALAKINLQSQGKKPGPRQHHYDSARPNQALHHYDGMTQKEPKPINCGTELSIAAIEGEKADIKDELQLMEGQLASLEAVQLADRPAMGSSKATCTSCHFRGHKRSTCRMPPCQGFAQVWYHQAPP